MRVLTDFHHWGLLRATNLLFGNRLGMEVYRPIGMAWFDDGFWAINNQRDTAEQFLRIGSQPLDDTPRLNETEEENNIGAFKVRDPGNHSTHLACTLAFFKHNKFDYVIASIPAHVPLFQDLIAKYNPEAKLIVQVGNNWDLSPYAGMNVLASTSPHMAPDVNAMFYHQEIDREFYKPADCLPTKRIYSFVNILQRSGQGWNDFIELEKLMTGFDFRSYGGQCRDGNMTGPEEMAKAMHDAEFILHSKPGGDGFGHVIFSAYACGRPVIVRPSQYKDQLAEQLLVDDTFIDLDRLGRRDVASMIRMITETPKYLLEIGARAAKRFDQVVNYPDEAKQISDWLEAL